MNKYENCERKRKPKRNLRKDEEKYLGKSYFKARIFITN